MKTIEPIPTTRVYKFAFLLIILGIAGVYLWPGLYIYKEVGTDVARTNKLTGVQQFATSEGWQTLDEMSKTAAKKRSDFEAKGQEENLKAQSPK